MKNYRKHIDDFFREKLGAYTETPPPEVWEDLEKRLDGLAMPGSYMRLLKHFIIVSLIAVVGISVTKSFSGGTNILFTNWFSSNNLSNGDMNKTTTTTPVSSNEIKGQRNEGKGDNNGVQNQGVRDNDTKTVDVAQNNNGAVNGQVNNGKTISGQLNTNSSKPIVSNAFSTSANIAMKKLAKVSKNKVHMHQTGAKLNLVKSNNTGSNPYPVESLIVKTVSESTGGKPGLGEEGNQNEGNQANLNSSSQKLDAKIKPTVAAQDKPKAIEEKITLKNGEKPAIVLSKPHFEAGVKVGYEKGFSSVSAGKDVVAGYLQYNINSKFSIMAQPTIKYSGFDFGKVGSAQKYYRENADSVTTAYGTVIKKIDVSGGTLDTVYSTPYNYKQSHDSIVKSYTYKGSYFEFELPILLKYKLSNHVAVYGGVNMIYGQLPSITESTYIQKGILRSVNDTNSTHGNAAPLALNSVITYSGNEYSTYKGPVYTNPSVSKLMFGYMLGFTYECSNHWLFDALIQQEPASSTTKLGNNITNPLNQTYFRLSVGYKLSK